MARYKVMLGGEEIRILLDTLESADFYSNDAEFYYQIKRLRKRLERLVYDYDYIKKRKKAGVVGYLNRKNKVMEEFFNSFLKEY